MYRLIIVLCLIFSGLCNAQDEDNNVVEFVDTEAEYPGGADDMMKDISKNFIYPQSAIENNLEGKVIVRFVINKKGKVSQAIIEKGFPECPECEKEAIRIVNEMPKWKPAKHNGRKVNCYYRLPIRFSLE